MPTQPLQPLLSRLPRCPAIFPEEPCILLEARQETSSFSFRCRIHRAHPREGKTGNLSLSIVALPILTTDLSLAHSLSPTFIIFCLCQNFLFQIVPEHLFSRNSLWKCCRDRLPTASLFVERTRSIDPIANVFPHHVGLMLSLRQLVRNKTVFHSLFPQKTNIRNVIRR